MALSGESIKLFDFEKEVEAAEELNPEEGLFTAFFLPNEYCLEYFNEYLLKRNDNAHHSMTKLYFVISNS